MIDKEGQGLIIQDYRLAKHPEKQIVIMSQIHAVSTADIRKILFDAGVYKVGHNEIERALHILQEGGKNHSLGGLRLWLTCFKDCGAKECSKILSDYWKQPWDEPIPSEEFEKALKKKDDDFTHPATVAAAPEFSETEKEIVLYGLKIQVEKRMAIHEEAWKEAEDRLREMQEASSRYEAAKEKADMAAAAVEVVKQLMRRFGGKE